MMATEKQASPLNFDFHIRGTGWSTPSDLPKMPRHRWFVVKEAFSPGIVEAAMLSAGWSAGDVVMDPFCGSGTSLVTAAAKGAHTVGCEVNPFLEFVTRTKLSAVAGNRSFARQASKAREGANRGQKSSLEGNSTFTWSSGAKKWLFNTEIARAFEGGWANTVDVPTPARNLLRLALIGAAMDCCNATQDGKCLRYRKDWKDRNYGREEFLDSFDTRVAQMREDIEGDSLPVLSSDIHRGDCRRTLSSCRMPKFRLCITSPPYLNSFDYSDIYRPEMFLGKFVADTAELRDLRLRTLRSHVQVSWPEPVEEDFGLLYTDSIAALRERKAALWDRRIPAMVQAYFEDMKNVVRGLRQHADSDAELWIVVSTSAYAGVEIPVDLIIADIAGRVGWRLKEIGVIRNLRSSGQHFRSVEGEHKNPLQLRESAVVLKAR